MEMENKTWPPQEKKNIDLSDRLDDVIERRQQGVYQEVERKKTIPAKRKKIYILIIVASWIVIAIVGMFLLSNKEDVQTEEFISPDEFLKQYQQNNE